MSNALDAEFAAELEPKLPFLRDLPKPQPHDIDTRRKIISSLFKDQPLVPGVSQEVYPIPTPDGYILPILHLYSTQTVPIQDDTFAIKGIPALLHIHGGGFIALSPSNLAPELSEYVAATGIQIFSVDYRLAPENPFPKPLEDCWVALSWLMTNAAQFGVDESRIGVMGESAGGCLAAALTLLARDRRLEPQIARQILKYPMLDDRNVEEISPDVVSLLSTADVDTAWTAYIGGSKGTPSVSVYAAPGRVEDVSGLPPLFMDVGQLDLCAKEAQQYMSKFLHAGIEVDFHLYSGLPHGFEYLTPNHRVVDEMKKNRFKQIRKL